MDPNVSLTDRSARLPLFKGDQVKWSLWWRRFQAYADVNRFGDVLVVDELSDMPPTAFAALDPAVATDVPKITARKMQFAAVSAFTNAFETEALMSHIDESANADWPRGRAHLIVKSLLEKYQPTDMMSKVELAKELEKITMTSDEDPVTLFVQMTSIETRYGVSMKFEEKLAKVLEVCPDKYKTEIVSETRRLPSNQDIGVIRAVMHNYWRVLNIGRPGIHDEDSDKELGMGALADVTCNFCKKRGHLMKDCFKKKRLDAEKNGKPGDKPPGKFQGKCNHCGKTGHKEAACWDKPGNNAKRPAWFKDLKKKDRQEAGNAAVDEKDDDGRVEYMMAGIEESVVVKPEAATIIQQFHYDYERKVEREERRRTYVSFYDSDSDSDDEANDPASLNWVPKSRLWKRHPALDPPFEKYDSEGFSLTEDIELYDNTCEVDEGLAETGCAGLEKLHSFPDSQKLLSHPNFWIADTAASIHMTPHKIGLRNPRKVAHSISLGDKSGITSGMAGEIHGMLCSKHGNIVGSAKLTDVAITEKGFNLFSITKLQLDGWKLGGNKEAIWLEKHGRQIKFDIKIRTKKGAVFAAFIQREVGAAGVSESDAKVPITYQQVHDTLGHMGKAETLKTAKYLGWDVIKIPNKDPCEHCEVGKAKQKSLPQVSTGEPLKVGERRIHLDLSSIKPKRNVEGMIIGKAMPKPNWRIMVDATTHRKFCDFYVTKGDMVEPTCAILKYWKQCGRPVTVIRMDNGGENLKLMERCKSAAWQLGIRFELTARDTPQQNSLAEVGFATLGNRNRAMFYRACIPVQHRHLLWAAGLLLAADLDSLVVVTVNGKTTTRFEHDEGKPPEFAKYLRTFGEAGVVKLKTSTTPKILNKGATCLFVGYPRDHAAGCWRMYNPANKGYHVTRDVVWLRRMYFSRDENRKEIGVGDESAPIEIVEAVGTVSTADAVQQAVTVAVEAGESLGVPPTGNNNQPQEQNPFVAVVEAQEEAAMQQMPAPEDTLQYNSDSSGDEVPASTAKKRTTKEYRGFTTVTKTRSGRTVQPRDFLIKDPEFGSATLATGPMLSDVEKNYYSCLLELGCSAIDKLQDQGNDGELASVGAALGGGFVNTAELKPMKYDEAMASPDRVGWIQAVREEFDRMLEHKVFQLWPLKLLPAGVKLMTSTWACKKKSNGSLRARINQRGFEQVDGVHFDKDDKASPTVNITTVRIVLVIMCLMKGAAHLVDVNGAFLLGSWESHPITHEQRKVFMEVPQGFHEFLPPGEWVLLLLKTLYGSVQAAKRFWIFLLSVFLAMGYKYNRVDPCLYYRWTEAGLVLWVSWVDDCLCIGPNDQVVVSEKKKMTGRLKCDDLGEMKEYVGCKIDYKRESQSCKFTQPVLLQSLNDEFELPDENPTTPAAADTVLQQAAGDATLTPKRQSTYRSGVGKMLHVMRWSRPDTLNATREVSRFLQQPNPAHDKALHRVLEYCAKTPERGLLLAPKGFWDGRDRNYEFKIRAKSDSEYAKDAMTRRSVGGHVVYLNGAPVIMSSKMHRIVAMSVTEAETIEACEAGQDMLYVYRLLKDMELKVELPMILEIDNQGTVDIVNNWSSSGRTRHMDVRYKFLRELKEANVIRCVWCPGSKNESDTFTKNLSGPLFEKHNKKFVGEDEYMTGSKGESVAVA